MRLRDNIFWHLKVPIPLFRERYYIPCSRFMRHRQEPYRGFFDRKCGYYNMNHNKHVDVPEEE